MSAEQNTPSSIESGASPPLPGGHAEPDASSVPLLEPPAPIASRFVVQRGPGWYRERFQETPSWLASLVAHLCILVTLGSFLVPIKNSPRPIDLLLFFTEADDEEEVGDVVVMAQSPLEDVAKETRGDEGEEFESPDREEAPVVDEPITDTENSEEPPAEPMAEEEKPKEPATKPLLVDKGEEIPPEIRDLFTPALNSSVTTGVSVSTAVVPPGLDRRNDMDNVVDRFIEYDIGRLRGQAGAAANRAFRALGPEAIPALVRGLNKSAGIQASCPVMVIASQLENQLHSSGDPVLVRYALDHLGDDVSRNAPHAGRIRQLKQRLAQHFIDSDRQIRLAAGKWGIPMTDPLLESVRTSMGKSNRDIRVQISGPDPAKRVSGLIAISMRDHRFDYNERHEMAESMIAQLGKETDARMMMVFHQAVEGLATSQGCESVKAAGNPVGLASNWNASWQARKRDIRSANAARLLAEGRNAANRGQANRAGVVYRQVIAQFPETNSASLANDLLRSIDFSKIAASDLRRAIALENAGRQTAAARYYTQIMQKYPKTEAARDARRRMSAGRRGVPVVSSGSD